MAKIMEFEQSNPRCMECEAALADALDGTLSTEEQRRFDAHIASCARCSEMLGEAQRGAAWLEMLRTPRPEPSAMLLERILAQTSGREEINAGLVTPELQVWPVVEVPRTRPGVVLTFPARLAASPRFEALRYNLLQPRLAMTAAMAFFSVALTLNLTGVRLNEIHASDLGPAGLRRVVSDTGARAARYYDNLKVVYVMESRLEDLRRNREDDDALHPRDRSESAPKPSEAVPQTPRQERRPPERRVPGPGTSLKEKPQGVSSSPRLLRVTDATAASQQPENPASLVSAYAGEKEAGDE